VGLVSVNSAGEQGTEDSRDPSISADGRYVAFSSLSRNLVAGDSTIFGQGIFVRDLLTGTTTQANLRGASGNSADWGGDYVAISADGSCVGFRSSGPFFVGFSDTNGVSDIFVHDRDTDTTSRVSVSDTGVEANGPSSNPSISSDCRYIAFGSLASNLVTGITTTVNNVFIRDRDTGSTELVSVDSAGVEGNGYSSNASVSADGRYVAFNSSASNLVTGDNNGFTDVFLHDRNTGTTTRVSVSSAGLEGNSLSDEPSVSANGRYVAFASLSSNLVSGDTNGAEDIFIHDSDTGTTTRVSVDSAGVEGDNGSRLPSISADGRYVAFDSAAKNLVAGENTIRSGHIYVHDRNTATTRRLSDDALGIEGNNADYDPKISADGRYVTFMSLSTNLVPGDANGRRDIFIRAVPKVSITSVVPEMLPIGATTSVTITGTDFLSGVSPQINGAQLSNIVIVDENTMTMDATVNSGANSGARDVVVLLYGTGAGAFTGSSNICDLCVTLF